jgi:hypothetical protein
VGGGARVSRRALLGGAAAVAAAGLSGCGSRSAVPAADTASGPSGGDRAVALAALQDEAGGLALYAELARRTQPLRGRLHRLVAVQQQHVDALETALGGASAHATDRLTPGPAADAIATEAKGLSARRLADCRKVADGALASMFASMAAAHAVVAAQWDRE